MQLINDDLRFSPSDLITFMESPFASAMERLRLNDPSISELMDPEDELLKKLQQKGYEHEDAFTASLREAGISVHELETKRLSRAQMAAETIKLMEAGQDVIAQGYLQHGQFGGFTDFLKKVPGPSKLGDYHYEVWDTKLSRTIKPYFIVQLCCYVEMLETIQGVKPREIVILLGDNREERLKVANYYAYYRSLKSAFIEFHRKFDGERPDPAASKAYGRWRELATRELIERDHLSQVAGLQHQQVKNLNLVGIHTMADLASTDMTRVPKMGDAALTKLKKQADLQSRSKGLSLPIYEVLPHPEGKEAGLALLPPHSDKDVFFDIEGYPSIEGGLEYLWGNTYFDKNGERAFIDFWAHDHTQEKETFGAFINWVYDRWLADPNMHVYHYANYEIAAIRKLMGRYGVCEEKVDNLLRNNVFVDLYKVVTGGMMIGTPNYSIKSVELLYRGKRDTEVGNGGESIIVYENWRENPDGDTWETSKVLNDIRDYNIDDCDSTQELTEWLRERQAECGISYLVPEGEGELELPEEITEITRLRDLLLEKADSLRENNEEKCRLLETLAWSLEFHRRESKPIWWRLFDRMGQDYLELYDDMDCLAGLKRTAKPVKKTSTRKNAASLYEYSFDPNQPFKGAAKSFHVLGEQKLKVPVESYNAENGTIVFRTTKMLPTQMDIIPDEYISPDPIPASVKAVIENLLETDFQPCAITDFLTRSRPRIAGNNEGLIVGEDSSFLDKVVEASINLEDSTLCIQGPPGAGKTFTAKHIIGKLLNQGKRVGISSNSHKAITNLMDGAAQYCEKEGIDGSFVKVGGDKEDPIFELDNVQYAASIKTGLTDAPSLCVGGTAWAFCNDAAKDQFDYLFIDEAGQVSVANLIGMSRSTNNIILMGDQMQLGQPIQGSHPGESGMSILEYLLENHATIPGDLGIFLPKTYRMHPDVTKVISSQVYEDRLQSDTSAARHVVKTKGPSITEQAGIIFVPVEHEGNTQASDEEVEVIVKLAHEFLGAEFWPAENSEELRQIDWSDMLFVAPYNYQVNKLKTALGDKAKVGSVDKFQGQEAPIVFMSMCASDAAESPRGIDFLFSKNRLNVALSRAQALAVVVGNPALANTPVGKPEQMELINFYCEIAGSCHS